MKLITLNIQEKQEIISFIRTGQYPLHINNGSAKKSFRKRANKLEIDPEDGNTILIIKNPLFKLRFFAEEESRHKKDYIESIHNISGHPGRDRLYSLLKNKLYNYTRDELMNVLRQCSFCQSRNLLNTRPLITPIRSYFVGERFLFDLVNLRHYGDLNNGYKWLLVGLDSFSKFAWTFALKSKTAEEVNKSIEYVFLTFKPPLILHTDNGKEFVNQKMKDLCNKFNEVHVRGIGQMFFDSGAS
ncbi:SCAN domain-containing protein 3, partial [Dictyocoela muelleri]